MNTLNSLEELTALYGEPGPASLRKEADRVTPEYRAFIEQARFAALATVGPEGMDCSPRGDKGPVAVIHDEKTLLVPDRRGNNRIDSLRNIVRDPRVSLMFMIPGSSTIIRVNGQAKISADPDLLESLAEDGKAPRSVIVLTIDRMYFQCARALIRSDLWGDPDQDLVAALPTPGQILANMTDGEVGGETYDREWPERAAKSMW
ncbi:MAG: pyridoxamine 5'-phosphate oxidase family protein [Alphaproteobacteria bacterium]